MAQALTFAIPGDIETRTGGYLYDRRVMEEMRLAGLDVHHCRLPGSFPFPDARAIAATVSQLNGSPPGPILVDGLAWGALPHSDACRVAREVIALCHHPLGLETGLSAESAAQFVLNEKANLALAQRVIVTSPATAHLLAADFGVLRNQITVAIPGTERAARAHGSGGECVELIAVGAIIERKGYATLVEALAGLARTDWRLRIAGSLDRSPETVARLRELVEAHGLSDRIVLLGELAGTALATLYRSSDLFVLSSHYEGYGMVLGEAMAHGLPIVATTGGAAAETAPDDAALKVAPGDAGALAGAIGAAIGDKALRRALADASWRAGQRLPAWSQTAAIVAAAAAPGVRA